MESTGSIFSLVSSYCNWIFFGFCWESSKLDYRNAMFHDGSQKWPNTFMDNACHVSGNFLPFKGNCNDSQMAESTLLRFKTIAMICRLLLLNCSLFKKSAKSLGSKKLSECGNWILALPIPTFQNVGIFRAKIQFPQSESFTNLRHGKFPTNS
jgi:hypothetical protein